MLDYDSIPWLMAQDGLAAVRARRLLDLHREDDKDEILAIESELSGLQSRDGSFHQSLMKTAGIMNLLADLRAENSEKIISKASSYLFSVLKSQPGYEQARDVKPGGINIPCDGANANPDESLCGFFPHYGDRNNPDVVALGAREMNFYREYGPLFGPKNPVRDVRRSSFDRAGASSCYLWGLLPLSYTIEALCRAGYSNDQRLQPAVNVLLGVQRESGGWCRNLGGHPNCSIHSIRAIGSHTELRQSPYAERAIRRMQELPHSNIFATIQVVSRFHFPVAKEIIFNALEKIIPRQRKNGTFGKPCEVERVTAVMLALEAVNI